MRTIGAVTVALVLAGCTQFQTATDIADTQIYPTVRVTTCALSPALIEARQAERYEASGVFVDPDCQWRPGDTLEDYYGRR